MHAVVNMNKYRTRAVATSQTFELLSTCVYVIHYGWHVLKTVLDAVEFVSFHLSNNDVYIIYTASSRSAGP